MNRISLDYLESDIYDKKTMLSSLEGAGISLSDADKFNKDNTTSVKEGITFNIIPVSGSLISGSSRIIEGFVTGYEFIENGLKSHLNKDVSFTVLDISSYGGSVNGLFQLCKLIDKLSTEKPIYAVTSGMCCSAAYAIASSCTAVFSNSEDLIGSVGVRCTHFSYESNLEKEGVKATTVFAGKGKDFLSPYRDINGSELVKLEKDVTKTYNKFLDIVTSKRNVTRDFLLDFGADVLSGEDALNFGMIDFIVELDNKYDTIVSKYMESYMEKEEKNLVSLDNLEEAVAEAVLKDRQRTSKIISLGKELGCESLAQELSFSSSLTVEQSENLMRASSKDIEQKLKQNKVSNIDNSAQQEFNEELLSNAPNVESLDDEVTGNLLDSEKILSAFKITN